MTVYEIDPLSDPRWPEFLSRHPAASVFHTVEWLRAIQLTYQYRPVVFTTSAPGAPLDDGVAFCQIRSWLTGPRMVSLPFSDHCAPLGSSEAELETILEYVRGQCGSGQWNYAEIRPFHPGPATQRSYLPCERYYFHTINLEPDLDAIFARFQKSSVQRKIQKAEREGLVYDEGRSADLQEKFYQLLLMTRRKHLLPPQPRNWFANLADSLAGNLKIRMVSKDGAPVASILTLQFKKTMVYKYGCSVPALNNLGGTPYLFWKAIQEAKASGLTELDLGRSGIDNEGLITFKERLGGERSVLTYLRFPEKTVHAHNSWKMQLAGKIFARMPDNVLSATGKILYRHIG